MCDSCFSFKSHDIEEESNDQAWCMTCELTIFADTAEVYHKNHKVCFEEVEN